MESIEKLQVDTKKYLPFWLARPPVSNRELRLDKKIVHGASLLDDLPHANTQGHAVIVIFQIVRPDGRSPQVGATTNW